MSKGRGGGDVARAPGRWLQELPLPAFLWRLSVRGLELRNFNRAALEFTRGRVAGLRGMRASELYGRAPEMGRLLQACLEQRATQRAHGRCNPTNTGELGEFDVTCLFQPPDDVLVLAFDLEPATVRAPCRSVPGCRDEGAGAIVEARLAEDIGGTRQADERLRFLSSAVEQAADQVFITDRGGRILYANSAFETHTGFRRGELLGQTPRLLKSGRHPAAFYETLWRTILSGQVFRATCINRKRDGSTYFEEKTIAPIRDAQGEITHFVSAGRDVSERRRTEEEQARLQEALGEAAVEWRTTFDAVDSLMLVLDGSGCIERLNRAAREALGKSYAELQGLPLRDLAAGRVLWSKSAEAGQRVLAEGRSHTAQVEDEEGRTWDVSVVVAPAARSGGRRVIVTARDVTPLVALQESLRRSETMSAMGRIVAGVAHEVRNPLFAISATVDAFSEELLDQPEFRQYSALLKNEVERLTGLMQDLLDYGRPSPVRLEPGPIATVFERAMRFCEPQAAAAGVKVACDPAGRLPLVPMDRGRLVQVFQNLLGNAIEHAPRGSEVRLAAGLTADGTAVECRVEDCGPGFREDDLLRVFEPFFTRRRGGTGLGLSIVERLVAAHGGGVCVGNRSEGGAVVTVRLPLSGAS